MRHFHHELLRVLAGQSRREAMCSVEVHRDLHAFNRAKDRDNVFRLISNIWRFGMLEKCAAKAFDDAASGNERRKAANISRATGGSSTHRVSEDADG